jgi:hypothetical protein
VNCGLWDLRKRTATATVVLFPLDDMRALKERRKPLQGDNEWN